MNEPLQLDDEGAPKGEAKGDLSRGTVLVTGADGFLGRYTVRRLISARYSVVGASRAAAPSQTAVGAYRHLQVDLADPSCIDRITQAGVNPLCAIVHLAAVFPASLTSPEAVECGRQNLRMDRHLVDASRRLECPLVYASTAAVYATDTMRDKREDGPVLDTRAYAREKLETEREAALRLAESGIPFTALRITAPYGAGQLTRTVVRIFLDRAIQNQKLLYHGSGSREQDFVHASDVADAVLAAIGKAQTGIFNIGSGTPVTMRELAEVAVRVVPDCRSPVEPSGVADPEEGRYARIPVAKAAAQLGWRPRTTLADGLSRWAGFLLVQQSDASRVSI